LKILLDEMLPAGVAGLLPGHDVVSVQQAGYKGLTNGEPLRRATSDGYAVLLTADRNLPAQQNIAAVGIAVVLVRGNERASGTRATATAAYSTCRPPEAPKRPAAAPRSRRSPAARLPE